MLDRKSTRRAKAPTNLLTGGMSRDFSDSTILADRIQDCGMLQFPLSGLMVVSSSEGHWVVPPSKALWLAPKVRYRIRMLGKVRLRSVSIAHAAAASLPKRSGLLSVSSLARELITELAATSLADLPTERIQVLTKLLLEEIKQQSPCPFQLPTPRDHRLAMICTHIQEHPDDMTTLHQWARELGYDRRTLHRLFEHEMGVTFIQWRQQAKLIAALELLSEGRPVIAVALELGYQTQSAFSTMFRRTLGITPSNFQRSLLSS